MHKNNKPKSQKKKTVNPYFTPSYNNLYNFNPKKISAIQKMLKLKIMLCKPDKQQKTIKKLKKFLKLKS